MNKQSRPTSKPQRIPNFISRFILSTALLILLWVIFLFIKNGVSSPIWNYLLIFVLGIVAFILHHTQKDRQFIFWVKCKFPKLTSQKILIIAMVISVIVGIILRCIFIVIGNRYNPTESLSDTGVHWFGGTTIANDGHLSDGIAVYEGFFPYLITYSATLSVFINIFGQNIIAIVVSNLLFDLIAVTLLYVLLYKWQNKKAACIGVILWMLNPLEILYCGVSMAIIITNMFVVLIALIALLCIQNYKAGNRLFLAYAAILGISIGIGNAYRPLFSVFIIATFIMLLLEVIRRRSHIVLFISGIIATIICLLLTNIVVETGWCKVDSYSIGNTGVGWSFMLGANYDSWGRWNQEDSRWFGEGLSKEDINGEDFLVMQQEFSQAGIDRYLAMKPWQFVVHMLHKTEVLFTEPNRSSMTWPVLEAYHVSENNSIYRTIHGAGIMLFALSVILTFIYLYHQFIQKKHDQTTIFLALCLCGLVAASLLVEVMWRYAMPIMVIFTMFAAVQLTYFIDKATRAIVKPSSSPPKTASSSQS